MRAPYQATIQPRDVNVYLLQESELEGLSSSTEGVGWWAQVAAFFLAIAIGNFASGLTLGDDLTATQVAMFRVGPVFCALFALAAGVSARREKSRQTALLDRVKHAAQPGSLSAEATPLIAPDAAVEILSPLGGSVPWKVRVSGSVQPPGSKVQLFVFSRGDEWWGQAVKVSGSLWEAPACQVGGEGESDFNYRLVAVVGAPYTKGPVRDLPEGTARSEEITVTRR